MHLFEGRTSEELDEAEEDDQGRQEVLGPGHGGGGSASRRSRRADPAFGPFSRFADFDRHQPRRPADREGRQGRCAERRPGHRRGQRPCRVHAGGAHPRGHVHRVQPGRPADRHGEHRPDRQALGRRDRAGGPHPPGSYCRRRSAWPSAPTAIASSRAASTRRPGSGTRRPSRPVTHRPAPPRTEIEAGRAIQPRPVVARDITRGRGKDCVFRDHKAQWLGEILN